MKYHLYVNFLCRNNVKSRYKTSLFKHRPPREPCGMQILPLPSKCKLLTKKSSSALKHTPHFSPINEDNIVTMIEMEENNNDNENQKVSFYRQKT